MAAARRHRRGLPRADAPGGTGGVGAFPPAGSDGSPARQLEDVVLSAAPTRAVVGRDPLSSPPVADGPRLQAAAKSTGLQPLLRVSTGDSGPPSPDPSRSPLAGVGGAPAQRPQRRRQLGESTTSKVTGIAARRRAYQSGSLGAGASSRVRSPSAASSRARLRGTQRRTHCGGASTSTSTAYGQPCESVPPPRPGRRGPRAA